MSGIVKVVLVVVVLMMGFTLGRVGVEPEAVTKTETVTKEVPTPAETVTEPVEVKATPDECINALDASEKVADLVTQAMDVAATNTGLIYPAMKAGFNQDASAVRRITAEVKSGTTKMTALNDELAALVPEYNTNAEVCRASGE